jgi:16S rRNA (cytosine967-C5)-methyltransferase
VSANTTRDVTLDRPRQVAFDVLSAVTEQDAYATLLLPARLRSAHMIGRDAAFATELTYGTLRWQGSYDAICNACTDRSPSDIDPRVREVLRLGAHQLFSMNVPNHAAVATSVELAKKNGHRAAAGFVNAVLRRMAGASFDEWMSTLTADLEADSDQALSIRFSHPKWLVSELRRALLVADRPESEITDLLKCHNAPAPVTLVARPRRSTVSELIDGGAKAGRWSPLAAVLDGGDPAQVPAVRDHRAGVQDEGSQLVALAMAAPSLSAEPGAGRWLDMCAGPGGKAAVLAALAPANGAELEAWELREHRAELVRQHVPSAVTVAVRDAGDPEVVREAAGRFARALLDAPCSGAGALRRRPEARWRKSAADLPRLVRGQIRLLHAAIALTEPGGVIGYATCSPLVGETTEVVDAVLAASPDVQQLDTRQFLPVEVADVGPGPAVHLWPHLHGTDAMYFALLRRTP